MGRFEFHVAEAPVLITPAGVCCHAWPFLSVWSSHKWGDGRKTQITWVDVDVGCNAGRSFKILPLSSASMAAHSQREVHRSGTNLLK